MANDENNELVPVQEPEVIMEFNDGYYFSKKHLLASHEKLGLNRKSKVIPKSSKDKDPINPDVQAIIDEFSISRAQAEKVFAENNGDLLKALRALVAS